MAKTVDQIRQQIARLQEQEKALLHKEVAGVVARIKAAVSHYGITVDQIFGDGTPARPARVARKASPKVARKKRESLKGQKAPAVVDDVVKPRPTRSAKGTKVAVKYRDESGNGWSGRGSQPRWLRAAVEAGKKLEDFLVA